VIVDLRLEVQVPDRRLDDHPKDLKDLIFNHVDGAEMEIDGDAWRIVVMTVK